MDTGCFYILATANNIAITYIYVQVSECLFPILLDIHLGVQLLGDVVVLCLIFSETAKLFSTVSTLFYIPHISAGCKHHLAQAEHSQGWVLGAVGTGRGHPYTETTRALSEGYRHSGKRSSEEVKC